ncbi:MAG: GntR family transcriptional regulator, N-acetylglucosamine utilization regulator [Petroclostridium sp.]|jgi:GntR family transcriptional regulator|uniref:GntR family transcriptional regulator n=1 Tax=Petroclostridium xylanilyticum TaxID=1792311 RepID=UPI000B9861DC|nr:GntR family transcriptional regulator [Petroclostridium xylanilyticum]MBZ4645446.1 yvoA [Clostridia bacterium]MDK2810960.1 GntR family transcriptional regulator, N-acetylglucosamine utilization regulator [Petroclostridium sp.]
MSLFQSKTLNKDIPIPLYYQLKEILLEYITKHHTDIDQPIPTEVELSSHFNISRPTVRQAINELVVEGYLYRVKGKGTFISKPKIKQDFLQILDSFNNEMQKKGLTPSTKILSLKVIKSDEKVSEALNLPIESDVVQLRRLRFANDEPIVVVVTYLPYEKCPGIITKNLENESLYKILENEYGLTLASATRTLESVLAGEYEAKLLQIEKGAPIQFFESITYLADGTPIEYSLAKYRGDRNKFTFELKRKDI